MSAKQNNKTLAEELRVLPELAGEEAAPQNSSWLTPQFWTMATTAATNLIAVAALIGWINSSDVEGVTRAATALVAAAQVIVVNSALVWSYIAGQNAVQVQKINARYKYMEAVAVEKLRAR